ncbi:MAG: hypothetical protein IPP47_30120 [Bryobacterales bacterium]|nr:hypothetical protein [Bryobacterales bacterium]
MPQGPEKFERTVDHQGADVKVKTTQSMQGNERTTDVAYTIDGKEHDIQMGPATAKVTASWKDATLEVVAKREIQGNAITSTECGPLRRWQAPHRGFHHRRPQGEFNSSSFSTNSKPSASFMRRGAARMNPLGYGFCGPRHNPVPL